jgi:hypothetical protein
MLPAFALAAMMSVAQAQTTDQDHSAHHPDGTAATQAAPSRAPGSTPMIGQGIGSGVVVQEGAQQPGGQPGAMTNMDQMRSMMGGQDGQSGMMDCMGKMMPMMRQMMVGQQDGMGMPFEHVEGRIAFLKTELKITDAQQSQWDAFANALRTIARTRQSVHEQMNKGGMPSSWPERLAFQKKALSNQLNSLSDLEAAAKPLYVSLTDEQRKLADQLLSGPMGMM